MSHDNPDFSSTLGEPIHTVKSVGTSEILACVGVSNQVGRERLTIINTSQGAGNKEIYVGVTGVTTAGANQGEELLPGDVWSEKYSEDAQIYIIGKAGTQAFIKESPVG